MGRRNGSFDRLQKLIYPSRIEVREGFLVAYFMRHRTRDPNETLCHDSRNYVLVSILISMFANATQAQACTREHQYVFGCRAFKMYLAYSLFPKAPILRFSSRDRFCDFECLDLVSHIFTSQKKRWGYF